MVYMCLVPIELCRASPLQGAYQIYPAFILFGSREPPRTIFQSTPNLPRGDPASRFWAKIVLPSFVRKDPDFTPQDPVFILLGRCAPEKDKNRVLRGNIGVFSDKVREHDFRPKSACGVPAG